MGELNVNPAGLEALAASCQGWSAELGATAIPSSAGSSCQATVAAVATVDAQTSTVAAACSTRMQSMAAQLVGAGGRYTQNEQRSATKLTVL